MNNNLYHWQAEQTVRYELHEVDRAVEQARLLREASLTGPGWFQRAVSGLVDLLKTHRKGLQEQHSLEPKAFPGKSASSA